jgi:alpha-tubulin suppressor-like RCC1 family protein
VAPEELPSFQISDGADGGANPHFFFLPPLQPAPAFSGTFDPALSPTIRICALSGSDCSGPDISTFSLTSSPAIVVDTAGENYKVNWATNGLDLSTSVNYRIQVFVGDVLLGFADVDVVANNQELKNVPPEFVGLVKDKHLQIKFRIEEGIVGQVTVTPATVTIEPEVTQQFTATLTDLHGNPLSGPSITWASDNIAVTTVDGNGLATGVGEGTAMIIATIQNVSGTATLIVASEPLEFAVVGAGEIHSCGVTTAGAAYCWGYNWRGQLGDGTNTDSNVPVAVSGGHNFTSVSAGGYHSCGLTTDGGAYCWGHNEQGQLGNGTNTNSNVPVAVSGGHNFTSVSAGDYHACGVTAAGAAYCWGANMWGRLGNGTNISSNVPVAVSGGHTFASVSAGYWHNCGVTTAGAAYCWGNNIAGELGNGMITGTNAVPVSVSGGHTFAAVSASEYHHSCGVTTAGVTYCWGSNYYGQLGNGTNTGSNVPLAVSTTEAFASVSTGVYYSCGVTMAGAAYCWGINQGQLGDGTNTQSNVPVAVWGDHTLVSVSAGSLHNCGVTTATAAYCWGWNGYGQLGNGTNTDSNVPVAVSAP